MPAELLHAIGVEFDVRRIERSGVRQRETHTACAKRIHVVERGVGNIARRDHDGPHRQADGRALFERAAIIRCIDARLDDHAALHAERIEYAPRVLRGCVGWRVFAARRIGVAGLRPEQMEMRVGRAGRPVEARLAHVGVGSLAGFGHSVSCVEGISLGF